MTREIRTKLIEIARVQTTWTYVTLNEQLLLGLNFRSKAERKLSGSWLEEIFSHTYALGRPLLSCLITQKRFTREQGDGFYGMYADLLWGNWQLLKSNKNWEKGLIASCYEFWLVPTNYLAFKNDF